jgi:hypothetical protein
VTVPGIMAVVGARGVKRVIVSRNFMIQASVSRVLSFSKTLLTNCFLYNYTIVSYVPRVKASRTRL